MIHDQTLLSLAFEKLVSLQFILLTVLRHILSNRIHQKIVQIKTLFFSSFILYRWYRPTVKWVDHPISFDNRYILSAVFMILLVVYRQSFTILLQVDVRIPRMRALFCASIINLHFTTKARLAGGEMRCVRSISERTAENES